MTSATSPADDTDTRESPVQSARPHPAHSLSGHVQPGHVQPGHWHGGHERAGHGLAGHSDDGQDRYEGEPRFAGPLYPTPAYAPAGRGSRLVSRLAARAPKWSAPVAIAACFAGAAAYVLLSNPTDSGARDLPSCLVKMTTGLDCPGCGGTRAFYYLLHGDLPQAVRHHAFAVFAAPFLVWLYVAWSVRKITGRSLPMPRLGGRTAAVFLAAWAVFMVVRNIPVAPFTYLYV